MLKELGFRHRWRREKEVFSNNGLEISFEAITNLGGEFNRVISFSVDDKFKLEDLTPELLETIKKHLEKKKWSY